VLVSIPRGLTHSAAATIGEIDLSVAGSMDSNFATGATGRATFRFGLRHFANNRSRFEKLPV
jgi:hypothetical protein